MSMLSPDAQTIDPKEEQTYETARSHAQRKTYLVAKRVLDILISVVGLIVMFLPMVIITVLIKLETPGPAIYIHNRIGKDGSQLPLLKFRSMCMNAEDMVDSFTVEQKAEWEKNFKFNNLTSVDKYCGTSALCCPHFVGITTDTDTVYLTEGVMKADIAHHLSRELGCPRAFVGLTGVGNINQFTRALEELSRMNIKKIKVAFDMDAAVNENVRMAKARVLETGCDAGFEMTPISWDLKWKGIDDLLLAMKQRRAMDADDI